MPDTQGFEVVVEVIPSVLLQFLQAAWDSSVIPHSTPIAAGTQFGPYTVADGTVNIPRTGLGLDLAPASDALRLTFDAEVQVQIANSPLPSASFFEMQTQIVVLAPPGVTPPGSIHVGILLSQLPPAAVSATLTSGDPIGPITLAMIEEYVNRRLSEGVIPNPSTDSAVPFYDTTVDVVATLSPASAALPTPSEATLTFPVDLRFSRSPAANVSLLTWPMEATAEIVLAVALTQTPGQLLADVGAATVTVKNVQPAANQAGANYETNKNYASIVGVNLEAVIEQRLTARAQALAGQIGEIDIAIPTEAEITAFIAAQAHAALVAHGDVPVWTPNPPAGSKVTINAVQPQVIAGALAIGINPGAGANASALADFVPASRSFAVGIGAAKTLALIEEAIHRPVNEGGFGPKFPSPPMVFPNIKGHEVKVTALEPSLRAGSIHLNGEVTVVDAIAGSIDVSCSFEADAGLEWTGGPNNTQALKAVNLGHDVHLSAAAWIISLLVGFITFGIMGGVVVIIIDAVAESVISSVGGQVITSKIDGQLEGLGAWPNVLEGIGTVVASFQNPIEINTEGLVLSG